MRTRKNFVFGHFSGSDVDNGRHPVLTCSKLTIETLEQGVKYA